MQNQGLAESVGWRVGGHMVYRVEGGGIRLRMMDIGCWVLGWRNSNSELQIQGLVCMGLYVCLCVRACVCACTLVREREREGERERARERERKKQREKESVCERARQRARETERKKNEVREYIGGLGLRDEGCMEWVQG